MSRSRTQKIKENARLAGKRKHEKMQTAEAVARYTGFRFANPKGIYTTKQRRHSGNKGGLQTVFMEEKVWPCKTPKIITKCIYHHPL